MATWWSLAAYFTPYLIFAVTTSQTSAAQARIYICGARAHLGERIGSLLHGRGKVAILDREVRGPLTDLEVVGLLGLGVRGRDQEREAVGAILPYTTEHHIQSSSPWAAARIFGDSPSVQSGKMKLLSSSLDRRDLLVGGGLAEVVVRDVPERALADEVAGLGLELVEVALELVEERDRVRGVGRLLDDRRELVLGDARHDLGEPERLVVHQVAQDLNTPPLAQPPSNPSPSTKHVYAAHILVEDLPGRCTAASHPTPPPRRRSSRGARPSPRASRSR